MYEHIAYELRYEDLSSIGHDSIGHEGTKITLITPIELLIHIESEQHSLNVIAPERCRRETTKDKLANLLVSKITNHRMSSP
jgi:hypothetical protein